MIIIIKIEEQKLFNLQKFLFYSFIQLHIDQCESFNVGVELISIILLCSNARKNNI
jgi:hypothetical protein